MNKGYSTGDKQDGSRFKRKHDLFSLGMQWDEMPVEREMEDSWGHLVQVCGWMRAWIWIIQGCFCFTLDP